MTQSVMSHLNRLKDGADLIICIQGAMMRIKADDLIVTNEGISVRNTGINVRATENIQLANMIPVNYPVDRNDLENGKAIVFTYGPDKTLMAVAQCTSAMMACMRAQIIRDIEIMARNDNMVLIGTSLEGETLHRTIDITVSKYGIDLGNTRLVNWEDVNATHSDEHLLVAYGNNQILTFAVNC